MDGFGPLDHASVDRTAAKKSSYRIGEGQWVCDFTYVICDKQL